MDGEVNLDIYFSIFSKTANWNFKADGAVVGSFDGDTGERFWFGCLWLLQC